MVRRLTVDCHMPNGLCSARTWVVRTRFEAGPGEQEVEAARGEVRPVAGDVEVIPPGTADRGLPACEVGDADQDHAARRQPAGDRGERGGRGRRGARGRARGSPRRATPARASAVSIVSGRRSTAYCSRAARTPAPGRLDPLGLEAGRPGGGDEPAAAGADVEQARPGPPGGRRRPRSRVGRPGGAGAVEQGQAPAVEAVEQGAGGPAQAGLVGGVGAGVVGLGRGRRVGHGGRADLAAQQPDRRPVGASAGVTSRQGDRRPPQAGQTRGEWVNRRGRGSRSPGARRG